VEAGRVTAVWITIAAVAVANFVIKASGPVLLGQRELPRLAVDLIALLAPAILAALIVVETFSDETSLRLDAQAAGVAVAGLAFVVRVPLLLAIGLGVAAAALLRAV
jgi:branched-subunit amino acid transport protein